MLYPYFAGKKHSIYGFKLPFNVLREPISPVTPDREIAKAEASLPSGPLSAAGRRMLFGLTSERYHRMTGRQWRKDRFHNLVNKQIERLSIRFPTSVLLGREEQYDSGIDWM